MNIPVPLYATGGLFTAKSRLELRSHLDQCDKMGIESTAMSVRGWLAVTLHSATQLVPEANVDARTYEYYFLLRESGPQKFLLASTDAKLVEILLEKLGLKAQVAKPVVNISEMVAELCSKPAEYSLSAVYARIEGFGQALRSAAFYGNDIGEAAMFRQLLPKLNPHRVMLRDIAHRRDVISTSYWGDIGFTYQGASSLRDTDSALRFLSKMRYLDWDTDMAMNAEGGEASDGPH